VCQYSTAKLPDLNFTINYIEITNFEEDVVKVPPTSTIFAIIKADLRK